MRLKHPIPITRALSLASTMLSLLVLLVLIGPGCLAPGPDDPDDDSSIQEMAPEMTMMTQQALVSTGPVNLALQKATTQSSTLPGGNGNNYAAWFPVNGSTLTGYYNHTADGDANPWWQVDLGQDQLVGSIVIYNRDTDAIALERLNGAKAELINYAGQTVQSWALTGAAQQTLYAMDGRVGRYVKISRSGGWIHLREVQVFSPVTMNIAEGKPTSQSTIGPWGSLTSASAVDGITDSGFTHTANGDSSPWWQLDLGGDYPVSSVEVHNRVDCCSERLNGATVHLQNAAHQDVKTWTLNSSAVQTFWAAGSVAHYVRITQPPGSWWQGTVDADFDGVLDPVFVPPPFLSLTEVAVKVPFTKNIAPGKSASQSTTGPWGSGTAASAINGVTDSDFTHTATGDNNASWTLDLGATSFVTSVDVHNRRDCCANRLNSAEIVLLSSVTPYREVKNTKRTLTGDPMQRVDFMTARRARYVRITRPGDYLSLAEVAVNSPIIAPAVAPPSTEFCWLDSYGRGVGQVPITCADGSPPQAGLCYSACTQPSPHGAGYTGVGPVCWENCPSGWNDTGAFCYKPGDIYGNGCSGQCQAGYTNDGCTCRRDPSTFAKNSYGIGVGQVPVCGPGLEYDALLCYTPCNTAAGYHGVGPVCWGQCAAGTVACGAGCAKDQATCDATLADMITAPFQAIANIAAMVLSFGGSSALQVTGKVVAAGVKSGIKEGLKQGIKAGVNSRIAGDTAEKISVQLDPMESTDGNATINVAEIAAACDPTGLASLGLAFAKPICGE